MSPGGRVIPLRRSRAGLWVLLGLVVLTVVGQAVPLYTDWLWFQEVGFTTVFTLSHDLAAAIRAAAVGGLEVARRPDASPAALLGATE